MHSNRVGEQGHFPFRSERLTCENGQWCFLTREGVLHGPFPTKDEAEKSLVVFMAEKLTEASAETGEAPNSLSGVQDDLSEMLEELIAFFRSRDGAGVNAALAWAHNRVAELRDSSRDNPLAKRRIEILLFAIDKAEDLAFQRVTRLA